MHFTTSKIGREETVGEKLRAARQERGADLATASKKTGIKQEYLEALEDGAANRLPKGVYEKTFLKKYSAWLRLDTERIIKEYEKQNGGAQPQKSTVFSKRIVARVKFLVFPKLIRNFLAVLAIAIFFLYLGLYLRNSFALPKIEISSPPDNLVTEDNFVEVIGNAGSKTQVTINDKQVLKDKAGNFQEKIELKNGVNTVVIAAQNKYSQKKIIKKQILVK